MPVKNIFKYLEVFCFCTIFIYKKVETLQGLCWGVFSIVFNPPNLTTLKKEDYVSNIKFLKTMK